jgi:hypothetical protein
MCSSVLVLAINIVGAKEFEAEHSRVRSSARHRLVCTYPWGIDTPRGSSASAPSHLVEAGSTAVAPTHTNETIGTSRADPEIRSARVDDRMDRYVLDHRRYADRRRGAPCARVNSLR